jgi:hypothetical protein
LPGSTNRVRLTLGQNEPNPFRGATFIPYRAPAGREGTLSIVDAGGRRVRMFRLAEPAGVLEVDAAGLTPGVYFYSLQSGGERRSRKMVVLR